MNWEYLVKEIILYDCENPLEKILNEFGNSGWELVQITCVETNAPCFIFKRPVE